MSELRSPVYWVGGKFYSAKHIVNAFPSSRSYDAYVDLFGGAAHVLIKKPVRRHIEVYNDINNDLANFWMQCRDNTEALEERCRSLPYSRAIYYAYHKSLFDGTELEPLERAARWFFVLRSNFNAYLTSSPGGWSSSSKDNNHCGAQGYHTAIDLFSQMKTRFRHVMIDNRDFEQVFNQWNRPRTLFYVDPPYVDVEHYYEQFTLQDHERLANLLNNAQGYVALSYYPHPQIDRLYPADQWRRITWQTFKHSQRTKETHDVATEMLLCNYSAPTQSLWDTLPNTEEGSEVVA